MIEYTPAVLAKVNRGSIIESIHTGHIAVCDGSCNVRYYFGSMKRMTYFRSAAKPLIALAVLTTGVKEQFRLSYEEIAVMASSHSGEEHHIKVLSSFMKKLGLTEEMLQCGIHPPLDKDSERELYMKGKSPTVLHCNCSGKHLGVIAACMISGYSIKDYYMPDHPVQKLLTGIIAIFCRIEEQKIMKSVDGCGLTVYAVPLLNMAAAYANLSDRNFDGGRYREEQSDIIQAMTCYPEMVGASKKRYDTDVMKAFGSRIICKSGAEGAHCIGVIDRGMGIAIKIEDGSLRAIDPVAIETLLQTGVIKESELAAVSQYHKPPVLNHLVETVGIIEPVFNLKTH